MALGAAGDEREQRDGGRSYGAPRRIQKLADYRPHGQQPSVADRFQLLLHVRRVVCVLAAAVRIRGGHWRTAGRCTIETTINTFGFEVQPLHALHPPRYVAVFDGHNGKKAVRGQAANERMAGSKRVQLQFGIILPQGNVMGIEEVRLEQHIQRRLHVQPVRHKE